MKAVPIENETRSIGKPYNWNPEVHGPCGFLSVHDYVDSRGMHVMLSKWELEEGDLEKLQAGAPIYLAVHGQVHPVVCVYPGNPPREKTSDA